jgi:hypothetical protein
MVLSLREMGKEKSREQGCNRSRTTGLLTTDHRALSSCLVLLSSRGLTAQRSFDFAQEDKKQKGTDSKDLAAGDDADEFDLIALANGA